MQREYQLSLSRVKSFALKIAGQLRGGEIIALIGPLGSGKTTFTQELAKALGVKQKVLSPTFIVLQELSHLDLYRTKGFAELAALGLTQTWGTPQVITVIEWADKIHNRLPAKTISIYLSRDVI
jgi:tRNA threonylcarbamoyladenosine biosynthesis protein TsaE